MKNIQQQKAKARHKLKRKAERKLGHKVGMLTPAWDKRKKAIERRVAKEQAVAHKRSLERKEKNG